MSVKILLYTAKEAHFGPHRIDRTDMSGSSQPPIGPAAHRRRVLCVEGIDSAVLSCCGSYP